MRVRAIDENNDWLFGKGKNDYLVDSRAVGQMIKTRLQSFLGDCFFDSTDGIDWFEYLGTGRIEALKTAIRTRILNTENVTGLEELTVNLDSLRELHVSYKVTTAFGPNNDQILFTVG